MERTDAVRSPHAADRPIVFRAARRAVRHAARGAIIARGEDALVADDECADGPSGAGCTGRDEMGDLHEIRVPARPSVHREIMAEMGMIEVTKVMGVIGMMVVMDLHTATLAGGAVTPSPCSAHNHRLHTRRGD